MKKQPNLLIDFISLQNPVFIPLLINLIKNNRKPLKILTKNYIIDIYSLGITFKKKLIRISKEYKPSRKIMNLEYNMSNLLRCNIYHKYLKKQK